MICVIAAEADVAQVIKKNLGEMYPDWTFEVCTDAAELDKWSRKRPDVLVLSRFLPGEDAWSLLPDIPVMFAATHVVLLVGEDSEQTRSYIRKAAQYGLENYVSGTLPGDRPYTLPIALQYGRAEVMGGKSRRNKVRARQDSIPDRKSQNQNIECDDRLQKQCLDKLSYQCCLYNPPRPGQNGQDEAQTMTTPAWGSFLRSEDDVPRQKWNAQRGILVVVTCNKGGAGKTTTVATLAVALANADMEVIAVDTDFEGPDLETFFQLQVERGRGIEALAGRTKSLELLVEQLLLTPEKYPNLRILPGPADRTILPETLFRPGELADILDILVGWAPVVIVDTPPNFWTKPWLPDVFNMADLVIAVVDQSQFTMEDIRRYAPKLLQMGVRPEKIRLVLNKFLPRLHNPRKVEEAFCSGFKSSVPRKVLPCVIATIPNDWDAHVLKGYKGEAVGLDDARSQWHHLAAEVAAEAGQRYVKPEQKAKKGLLGLGFLRRRK
ncbi:MAG: AAA family ATPase [Peptococcaceae bacterium]|nr:AAA family ATPase [Peptococcaceae bacterium]